VSVGVNVIRWLRLKLLLRTNPLCDDWPNVPPVSSKLHACDVDKKGLREKPPVNEPLLNLMFCFKQKSAVDEDTA
jgi:hypothetical protein